MPPTVFEVIVRGGIKQWIRQLQLTSSPDETQGKLNEAIVASLETPPERRKPPKKKKTN